MGWIKRSWTPEEANDWSKEDWIAIVLSPVAYILIAIGSALAFLNLLIGYVALLLGILITVVMFWVINPKLSAVSLDYEQKQREYLDYLRKIEKWEEKQ